MSDDPRHSIRRLRERLEDSEEITASDADAIRRMSDRIDLLGPAQYSDHTHEKYLMRVTNLAQEVGGLADALDDRGAADQLVTWINTTYTDSPETNKDYRVSLRQFGRLATAGEEIPASLDWVPGGYPSTYDPAPHPEEMFRWVDHILPMIDACHNSRDRALIALAWDLGPRPSELFDLTVGRISDHKYGKKVTLYRGKQGTRSPVIVPSVPYVQQWLRDHPAGNRSDAPLWCKTTHAGEISNNRIRDIFKERARAATMTPPATEAPSRMRKSSASYLASQSTRQSHLEDHHGWRRGSKIAARYIGVFQEANDREVARAHGVEIDEADEADPIAPVECPRCQHDTPREQPHCVWCGQALSPSAVEAARERDTDMLRAVAEADDEELVEGIIEFKQLVDEYPALEAIMSDAE